MTNEQLAILLRAYLSRLDDEIQILDHALGDGVERHTRLTYIGPERTLEDNFRPIPEEHFTDMPTEAVLLDRLRNLADEMQHAIDDLLGRAESPE